MSDPFAVGAVALWLVTAYCPSYECGALGHGITASGTRAVEGVTVACPRTLPFGTRLAIEGVGVRVCEDRGSAIRGKHLDLFVGSLTHDGPDKGRQRALKWSHGRPVHRRVRVLWRPDRRATLPPWGNPGCPGEPKNPVDTRVRRVRR